MKILTIAKASVLAVALVVSSSAAHAVTLTSSVAFSDATFLYPDASNSVTLPSGASWDVPAEVRSGNQNGVYRTPWDETSNAAVENASVNNAGSIDFFATGPGNQPNPAKLIFDGVQNSLSFLWGSPDTYNDLIFYLAGAVVGEFEGSPITGSPSAGSVFVTYSGLFDEVWFKSDPNNAFEFASVTATPVPLPAAGWLLLAGIGGLVVMRRKRSA
ncbi:MAG: VPLPA-CTERM sorting domain-containing protein [Pseudomonadota bacterium]